MRLRKATKLAHEISRICKQSLMELFILTEAKLVCTEGPCWRLDPQPLDCSSFQTWGENTLNPIMAASLELR